MPILRLMFPVILNEDLRASVLDVKTTSPKRKLNEFVFIDQQQGSYDDKSERKCKR